MQLNKNTYLLECLLEKAKNSKFACILLSNGFSDPYGELDCLAGFGVEERFSDLSLVDLHSPVPLLGYVSYDYKNFIEPILKSPAPRLGEFDDVCFVQPKEWVLVGRSGELQGTSELLEAMATAERTGNADTLAKSGGLAGNDLAVVKWQAKTTRSQYLENIEAIKKHIVDGDFYEMNHCIAFSATSEINPYQAFLALNATAPAPFASFVKDGDRYLLCASPERFIGLKNGTLYSQPIKGTRKRVHGEGDSELVKALRNSEKDRAENVMIVDLVRNDMSRVCVAGSVVVPELCEVYTFSHVHQLISTVEGRLKPDMGVKDILHATFPMGSMTGAPKIAVMQHTEGLENFSRGLYSGTVGYVWNGNMDLNVVIRSLLYQSKTHELQYAVGGAITYDSVAEDEYQECLDKAETVLSIFPQ
jgi:para-aminobenzoate synthetase component I